MLPPPSRLHFHSSYFTSISTVLLFLPFPILYYLSILYLFSSSPLFSFFPALPVLHRHLSSCPSLPRSSPNRLHPLSEFQCSSCPSLPLSSPNRLHPLSEFQCSSCPSLPRSSPNRLHPPSEFQCSQTVLLSFLPYTGCPRRNGQNFRRVFLMLNYTDITQNTYIQS